MQTPSRRAIYCSSQEKPISLKMEGCRRENLVESFRLRMGTAALDRVARIVEVQGFLNTTEEFEDHPQVLNGCSDLLVEVFADKGVHARSVMGANSLRGGVPRVLKAIVEVTQE